MASASERIIDNLGGRSRAIILIVAFVISLLLFIAGAVMLGIGISKANSVADECPALQQPTTTQQPKKPNVAPKPFYLTVENRLIKNTDIETDYPKAVRQFHQQLYNSLNGWEPLISILSISPLSQPNQPGPHNTIGLIAITYLNTSSIASDDIKTAINKVVTLTVRKIIVADASPPSNANDQLCSVVNGGGVLPPPPPPPDTTTRAATTTSLPPPEDFEPCRKRFVFALDASYENSYYEHVEKFLAQHVFSGKWNHLERLAVFFYGGTPVEPPLNFNEIPQLGGLHFLQSFLVSHAKDNTHINVNAAMEYMQYVFPEKGPYDEIVYIVFLSHLTDTDVAAAQHAANALKEIGRLSIISLGDVDPIKAGRLSSNHIEWTDPDHIPDDWFAHFWNEIYGCGNDIPEPPPTLGTIPTLPPDHQTIPPIRPLPCDGRFELLLDGSSKSLTETQFQNQRNFVASKLFSSSYFNHYERVSLGFYTNVTNIPTFGTFKNEGMIKEFVLEFTRTQNLDSSLRRALSKLLNDDLPRRQKDPPITNIVFVSKIDDDIVKYSQETADKIREKERLVLISLGGLDENKLKKLTPDVFVWNAETTTEPNDYKNWARNVFGCSAPAEFQYELALAREARKRDKRNTETEMETIVEKNECNDGSECSSENEVSQTNDEFDPCGSYTQIFFDNSNILTKEELRTVKRFLSKRMLRNWNGFQRLILGFYNRVASHVTKGFFNTYDEVDVYIKSIHQSADKPSLRSYLTEPIMKAALPYVQKLSGKLTFIALKNVDKQLLAELSENAKIIDWSDLTMDSPLQWESFWEESKCSEPQPILPKSPSALLADVPYIPCKRSITLILDGTSTLSSELFASQKELFSQKVFKSFTHFERLHIGYYAKTVKQQIGNVHSAEAIHQLLSTVPQSVEPANLRRVFFQLSESRPDADFEQTVVLLVSEISGADVEHSIQHSQTLRKWARLALIGTQSSVDKSKLKELADFAEVVDLSRPLPSNVEEIFSRAYGC